MMKKTTVAVALLAVCLGLSCARNYREIIEPAENKFYEGRSAQALKTLKALAGEKGKDRLLYLMEYGTLLNAAGDYAASAAVLREAARLAETQPISITKEIEAILSSEGATNYRGEDFERVLIHLYLTCNYLMLGNYEAARVEARAINDEYQRIKATPDREGYRENLMARYLAAIAHEITGDAANDDDDREFAYIEYKRIHELDPDLPLVKVDLLRMAKKLRYNDDYGNWVRLFGPLDRGIPADAGELIVLHQAGRTAIKRSQGPLMESREMHAALVLAIGAIRLEAGVTAAAVLATLNTAENPFPVLVRRPCGIEYCDVILPDRTERTLELEDINASAKRNLDYNYRRLKDRLIRSIVVKAATSLAVGVAAREITKGAGGDNSLSAIIGLIAGLGTGAALFSQMQPDLRCWHTLPASLQMTRLFLKPGKYTLTLVFTDNNNTPKGKKQIDVELKSGEKVFINQRSLL